MHGRVAGGTSDQSQPGCVKELHIFPSCQRFVTLAGSKESHMPEPLFSEPDPSSPPSPPSPPSSPSPEAKGRDPLYFHTSAAVSSLNKCLAVGETPYSQSRARAKSYPREKVKIT